MKQNISDDLMEHLLNIAQSEFDTIEFHCPKCGCGCKPVCCPTGIESETDAPFDIRLNCSECGEFLIKVRMEDYELRFHIDGTDEEYNPTMDWSAVKAVDGFVESDYSDPIERCKKLTKLMEVAAQAYYVAGMMSECRSMSDKALEEFRKLYQTNPLMMDCFLNQLCTCASFAIEDRDENYALKYYREGIEKGGNTRTHGMVSLLLAYSISLFTFGGEDDESTEAIIERCIPMAEELFEDDAPKDDPFSLAIVYETAGIVKRSSDDIASAREYFRKSLREWKARLPCTEVNEDRLENLYDCYSNNLDVADESEWKEIVDDFIDVMSEYRYDFPTMYAKSLMMHFEYIQILNLDSRNTVDMEDVIRTLHDTEDPTGREILAKALMYRSLSDDTGTAESAKADLSLALSALMANIWMGADINDLFMNVASLYTLKLKTTDKKMYRTVMKSMNELGVTAEDLTNWFEDTSDLAGHL